MDLLLVESHRQLARILRAGLEEEGFGIETVDDPDKAMELLGSETYDVILLDLFPDRELAVLREWRQARITTPVLFLSTPGSLVEKLNDLGLGPGSALSKPFRFDSLLEQVRLLGRHFFRGQESGIRNQEANALP